MFSKIGELLGPSSQGGRNSGGQGGQNRKALAEETAPVSQTEDLVLLSLGAVRALVEEEETLQPQSQELLRKLSLLEQHGLQNLPVRAGQPVAEAIREAASFFGSGR